MPKNDLLSTNGLMLHRLPFDYKLDWGQNQTGTKKIFRFSPQKRRKEVSIPFPHPFCFQWLFAHLSTDMTQTFLSIPKETFWEKFMSSNALSISLSLSLALSQTHTHTHSQSHQPFDMSVCSFLCQSLSFFLTLACLSVSPGYNTHFLCISLSRSFSLSQSRHPCPYVHSFKSLWLFLSLAGLSRLYYSFPLSLL